MPKGKAFRLTDKRLAFIINELEHQMDLKSIASGIGCSYDCLYNRLNEAGIDWRDVKRRGIAKLRKNCMVWLADIDDPKDRVNVALKYLDKYDDSIIETKNVGSEVTIKSDADIKLQILQELSE